MNQSQLKYAQGRATSIFNARKTTLKAKHTTPAVTMTPTEKRRALNNRQFKVVDKDDRYSSSYMHNFISFNGERDEVFDDVAHGTELAALTLAFNTLMDELILGDHQEALKLLRDFEAA